MKTLMFGLDEIFRPLRSPLAKLLRVMFYKRGISTDDFVRMHTEWYTRMNLNPAARNHDRNNLRRTISSDDENLTWNTSTKVIINIFHDDIIEIAITVRNPRTGEVNTYTSNDIPYEEDTSDKTC